MFSLRARLLAGAIFWSIGIFLIVGILVIHMMFQHPRAPGMVHGFFAHTTILSIAALVSLIAGFVHVKGGVSPVNRLRARLAAVHEGRDRRVEGTYPSEVQPLVDDLNALLAHREEMVQRALAKAGDLAHGLKTPLAVLAQEAERAALEGHCDFAATIGQQVERMQRQIEYHLAHARAAASGATPGARCPVIESADGLTRTLLRLHAGRGLDIQLNVAPTHAVRAQREDLDEMLGNLLDNACKWATSRITVGSTQNERTIVITVDDDGPGVASEMWEAVLKRGVRADEAAPGSGLGLAIVRDLADVYGGSILLSRSPEGGVRASLMLPAS